MPHLMYLINRLRVSFLNKLSKSIFFLDDGGRGEEKGVEKHAL